MNILSKHEIIARNFLCDCGTNKYVKLRPAVVVEG